VHPWIRIHHFAKGPQKDIHTLVAAHRAEKENHSGGIVHAEVPAARHGIERRHLGEEDAVAHSMDSALFDVVVANQLSGALLAVDDHTGGHAAQHTARRNEPAARFVGQNIVHGDHDPLAA
jgi:hypothetical protein